MGESVKCARILRDCEMVRTIMKRGGWGGVLHRAGYRSRLIVSWHVCWGVVCTKHGIGRIKAFFAAYHGIDKSVG